MEQKIKIEPCKDECVSGFSQNMKSFLESKATELKGIGEDKDQVFLLSFHDDGVVWGKVQFNEAENELITSGDVENGSFKLVETPSPEFRYETLQELRLFGDNGQLHIWRKSETEFEGSLALESYLKDFEPIDEKQVLHGTDCESENGNFMIVCDGSEGLKHAFPLVDRSKFGNSKRPLRLHVKHYIEYDTDGCARIAFSRLVNVSVEGV